MTCVMTRGQPSYLSSSCTLVETEFLVQACINRLAVLQDLKNFLASASHHTAETQRYRWEHTTAWSGFGVFKLWSPG